jgi:hypothetical protein
MSIPPLPPRADADMDALASSDLEALREVWSQRFGPPPTLRSVELLRLMLAWRIQAAAQGCLDAATRRLLERRGPVVPEGRSLGLGAILRRTWRGRTVEAIVEADGFRFEGRLYPTLTAVAVAATGTRWSGPRFFGLRSARP